MQEEREDSGVREDEASFSHSPQKGDGICMRHQGAKGLRERRSLGEQEQQGLAAQRAGEVSGQSSGENSHRRIPGEEDARHERRGYEELLQGSGLREVRSLRCEGPEIAQLLSAALSGKNR